MALDGKAIKEEIPDKEVYDSGSVRRAKGESAASITNDGRFSVGETSRKPQINQSRTHRTADDRPFPTKPAIYGQSTEYFTRFLSPPTINHVLMRQLSTSCRTHNLVCAIDAAVDGHFPLYLRLFRCTGQR